jgi:imidazolonepropionase-like amidohydrolase
VRWCLSSGERTANVRNLPYAAARAAAYGLPRDAALRSVTLYPARILGVADRLGSLEPGKSATLIVTDGDPLEVPTKVEMAFVEGRRIDLSNKQTALFEKYVEKYRQKGLLPE